MNEAQVLKSVAGLIAADKALNEATAANAGNQTLEFLSVRLATARVHAEQDAAELLKLRKATK